MKTRWTIGITTENVDEEAVSRGVNEEGILYLYRIGAKLTFLSRAADETFQIGEDCPCPEHRGPRRLLQRPDRLLKGDDDER